MSYEHSWEGVVRWLNEPKEFSLIRGKPFTAVYNQKEQAINVVPKETGIVRTISEKEWDTFIEKVNSVTIEGYDPWKPGHYSKVTYNSSYLVAILKDYSSFSNISH